MLDRGVSGTTMVGSLFDKNGVEIVANGSVANQNVVNVGDYRFGGIVYYIFNSGDLGYVEGETHGLVMAERELPHRYQMGIVDVFSGTTSDSAIGTGLANTNTIIATWSGQTNGVKYAADVARNYKGGGYTDWFLPSLDEMNAMCPALWAGYTNLNQRGENFGTEEYHGRGIYWTSTATDQTAMGYLFFDNICVESGWNNGNPGWKSLGGATPNFYRSVMPVRKF